nr:MAG TPA: hypothetical protein [Caudoviricetes sp.]
MTQNPLQKLNVNSSYNVHGKLIQTTPHPQQK